MKIAILAIGKLRGPEAELCAEYLKRLKGEVVVREMATSKNLPPAETQKAEADLLIKNLPAKSFVVLLDERGKELGSREFASQLQRWQEQHAHLAFLIGGADGVTDSVRKRAQFTLAFGRMTWPHRLVRTMLLEQLYRARQIRDGHPYHRD